MSDNESQTRVYPYSAFRLLPSYRLQKVTLVGPGYDYGYPDYDRDPSGKTHHVRDLYPSEEAAIAAGVALLDVQAKDLEKRLKNGADRRAQLEKEAAKLPAPPPAG